jgi:hypothetical protein
VIHTFVTCIAEEDLIARIESLISELAGVGEVGGELERRRLETLMEGYGRALALEGQRRRLRERQVELADVLEPDAGALSELAALALREARVGRRERKLRAMLGPLRGGRRGAADATTLRDDPAAQRQNRSL